MKFVEKQRQKETCQTYTSFAGCGRERVRWFACGATVQPLVLPAATVRCSAGGFYLRLRVQLTLVGMVTPGGVAPSRYFSTIDGFDLQVSRSKC